MAFERGLFMALQKERGLTNPELQKRTGLNWYTIRDWRRGKHGPSKHSAELLAEALDCQVSDFWPDFGD